MSRKHKVLVPERFQMLPFLFLAKELMPEQQKEVIQKDPDNHRCLDRIKSLQGETPEGEILFQFFDSILIV